MPSVDGTQSGVVVEELQAVGTIHSTENYAVL